MGRLGRGPQRQLAVRRPHGDGGMLLHRQVCTALEEEQVFPDQVRLGDPRINVAEFEVDQLVEIAAVAVVVDARLGMRDRRMRGKARSSAKRVAPVTLATASTLRSAFPMTECLTVGMLEGGLPSNLPTFPRLAVAIQRFPGGLRDFPTHPCRSQLDRLVDLDV